MWRKLKRHACPLGGAGRFTYKKAPRAGRQALRSGGFCKSLNVKGTITGKPHPALRCCCAATGMRFWGEWTMKPDNSAKGIRFGCGFLFGLALGIALVARRYVLFYGSRGKTITFIIGVALVNGLVAMKYGDKFWNSFGRDL
jgi:hypothetical protein